MGGDFAPDVVIQGAGLAVSEFEEGDSLLLIGDDAIIEKSLARHGIADGKIEIRHAPDAIGMGEHPTKAIAQKPQASIPIGYRLLKEHAIEGFCSAGNTGAMHVGAMFSIKAIEGVIRPGIAGFVPKEKGGFGIVMDVGANADCKPDVLFQFGEIGNIYAREVFGIKKPRIGLMNLGSEEQKGTLLTQAAHQLFKISKQLNFVGNIEGGDVFNDRADVIVCDGFTGNVILKLAESFYDMIKLRNVQDAFFDRFNYEEIGGSPILGVNGNVVIGHGASSPTAIKNMILLTHRMAKSDIYFKLKDYFTA